MTRRTVPLPRDWNRTRIRIARRDNNLCRLRYAGCMRYAPLGAGGETDHIVPAWEGGSDDDENLQHACTHCHAIKTAREANRAKPSRRRPRRAGHPGLVR